MNINLKKYEEVSLEELEDISAKKFSASFSVMSSNDKGLIIVIPMKEIDIVLKGRCKRILGDSKYYVPKSLKKYFYNQNNFYKLKYDKEAVAENEQSIKDWMQAKLQIFKNMSIKEKEDFFIDLYNAIAIDNQNYNPDNKYIDIAIDVLFDIGLLMRVIFMDLLEYKTKNKKLEKQYNSLIATFKKSALKIQSAIIKYMESDKKQKLYFPSFRNNALLTVNLPISHSIRVFMMYTDFLYYYNRKCKNGLGGKIRRNFDKYIIKYNKVSTKFNNKENIKALEDVFKDGMQEIDKDIFQEYAMASFFHDIGKFYDIQYYIESTRHDPKRIKKHLFNSYKMLDAQKHSYNIIYTVAFHHEYYGFGYGPFIDMYRKKRETNPHFYSKNIISYDVYDVINCKAVAFFPSKVLEIIDVYDTIMHPWFDDQPLKSNNSKNTIAMMRQHFVDNSVKLDPVLFDLFEEYVGKL